MLYEVITVGKGIRNLVTKALPEPNRTEELIDRCLALMISEYNKNCTNKTRNNFV